MQEVVDLKEVEIEALQGEVDRLLGVKFQVRSFPLSFSGEDVG